MIPAGPEIPQTGPAQPADSAATALTGSSEDTVIVRASAAQRPGGVLRVGGLTVLERSLKQLSRGHRTVVLAASREFPLPAVLPAGVRVRPVDGAAAVGQLQQELGRPPIIEADVVRPSNRKDDEGLRVVDEITRRQAEDQIFAELLRGDLGFVARHLNKPVSFRITRHLLCRLPLTPNHVTLAAAAIGLLGCALIATGAYGSAAFGFLLAHLQSVLDGCDGELARVRFQQSALGEWLDTVIDDGMNLALIAAIGLGQWRATAVTSYLAWSGAAFVMLLAYNAVSYSELVRQRAGGEVLRIRWWFTRGQDIKGLYPNRVGGFGILMTVGRRDFFVLAWLLLALLNLGPLILAYAFVLALASFGVAVGQLIWTRRN